MLPNYEKILYALRGTKFFGLLIEVLRELDIAAGTFYRTADNLDGLLGEN